MSVELDQNRFGVEGLFCLSRMIESRLQLNPKLLAHHLQCTVGWLASRMNQVTPRVLGKMKNPVVPTDQNARRRIFLDHPLMKAPVGNRRNRWGAVYST